MQEHQLGTSSIRCARPSDTTLVDRPCGAVPSRRSQRHWCCELSTAEPAAMHNCISWHERYSFETLALPVPQVAGHRLGNGPARSRAPASTFRSTRNGPGMPASTPGPWDLLERQAKPFGVPGGTTSRPERPGVWHGLPGGPASRLAASHLRGPRFTTTQLDHLLSSVTLILTRPLGRVADYPPALAAASGHISPTVVVLIGGPSPNMVRDGLL
jgi:hypothetical protein